VVLTEIDAMCTGCGMRQRGTPTRSFVGFQKFVCPHCSVRFLYPLTDRYLTFAALV